MATSIYDFNTQNSGLGQQGGYGFQMPNQNQDFSGIQNFGMNSQPQGFGFNLPTLGGAFQGLSSLGNIWNAFQSQKLAKDQFNFAKQTGETNLANSIQSYNTQIQDRARARGAAEGQSDAAIQDYIARNNLTRK